MEKKSFYVPIMLICIIGAKLQELDNNGKRVFSTRYLQGQHLSGRAQSLFLHHEAVSVLQLYAAIRILLINAHTEWDRILLMAHFMDILEDCFCKCYPDANSQHPFGAGMEQMIHQKMRAMPNYDLSKVLRL